jgi:hypothetical protein
MLCPLRYLQKYFKIFLFSVLPLAATKNFNVLVQSLLCPWGETTRPSSCVSACLLIGMENSRDCFLERQYRTQLIFTMDKFAMLYKHSPLAGPKVIRLLQLHPRTKDNELPCDQIHVNHDVCCPEHAHTADLWSQRAQQSVVRSVAVQYYGFCKQTDRCEGVSSTVVVA